MDGPFNTLAAYTHAIGVELELLSGVPVTLLRENFLPTATSILVQSTLGFPPSGYIRVHGVQVYYAGKTPIRFTGLVYDHLISIPNGSLILSNTRKQLPDSYELFWVMPWDGNNNGVELDD